MSYQCIGLITILTVGTVLPGATRASSNLQVVERLASVDVPFVANAGQSDPQVAYYATTFSGTVFVTRQGEIVYAIPGGKGRTRQAWSLTETFVGGRGAPLPTHPAGTQANFFVGDDPAHWRVRVPTYSAIDLGEVYGGIDVSLRAHGQQVEKVFTVQPGAQVTPVRLRVAGAHRLAVASDGALMLPTGIGNLRLTSPVAYQEVDGQRHAVDVSYDVAGDEYGFRIGHMTGRDRLSSTRCWLPISATAR
jgi:hypothetical protein